MGKSIVSQWEALVKESEKGVDIYVGVDVHKSKYAVTVLSATGLHHSFSMIANNDKLLNIFRDRNLKVSGLAYEAGLTGFTLYRACQQAGVKAMVVAACRLPRPVTRMAKTDRIDSLKLAQYLAAGLLSPIAVPSEDQEARRALVRCRSQMTQEMAELKTRIKSFLTVHGLPEPAGLTNWSEASLTVLEQMSLHPHLRRTLDHYLRQLRFFQEEQRSVESEMKVELAEATDNLQSIPGVGPITSAVFVTEIFDPKRFKRAEELSSFIGLAPVIRQSGASEGQGRLVPCGQGKLRQMLIEAAWMLIRKESWARDIYQRLIKRGRKSPQAITAIARKLAIIMWRLLQENRRYVSSYRGMEETAK